MRSLGILVFLFISVTNGFSQEPLAMSGMVDRHNFWRKEFNLPAVKWSTEIATSAQLWANQLQKQGCNLVHSNGKYGENIFWSSGGTVTATNVVDSWAEEKQNYNFDTFKCKPGAVCGHYTQLVWETTTEIGCGMASCGEEQVWVCQYNPPGNWVGKKPFNK